MWRREFLECRRCRRGANAPSVPSGTSGMSEEKADFRIVPDPNSIGMFAMTALLSLAGDGLLALLLLLPLLWLWRLLLLLLPPPWWSSVAYWWVESGATRLGTCEEEEEEQARPGACVETMGGGSLGGGGIVPLEASVVSLWVGLALEALLVVFMEWISRWPSRACQRASACWHCSHFPEGEPLHSHGASSSSALEASTCGALFCTMTCSSMASSMD
mmetsp:Transcript_33931/g.72329  ORF Transcript_33931/g.72329 Transcript_33931/m.72329 type:complete len:217 (+) Transcript_33931:382-1032(+)